MYENTVNCILRDLVRVATLTDMTRSMTAPLVHIKKLEKKRPAEAVLQKTGDNVNLTRRFSEVNLVHQSTTKRLRSKKMFTIYNFNPFCRRTSEKAEFSNNYHDQGLPNILEVLDKVDHSPIADEGYADACWRIFFNKMANFNWLGKVRKTKLYHNTEDVINRLSFLTADEPF